MNVQRMIGVAIGVVIGGILGYCYAGSAAFELGATDADIGALLGKVAVGMGIGALIGLMIRR